jgi:uncharacterized phage-associated protein
VLILTFVKKLLKCESIGPNQRGAKMANVFDVARYILDKQGSMTVMKLQKLVYYCQAWSLVWDDKPLFAEEIQAWASGPVVRKLYNAHKGMFAISDISKGDVDNLNTEQKATIDSVLKAYGDKSALWLADLTHMEDPWKKAREGYEPGDNCENEITLASIAEYYSSLTPDCEPI